MSVAKMSDEEILEKIIELKKNESSYSEVIRRYYEEIYNRYYLQCYNISRYYGLSRQDAEDVVQETFLRFIARGHTFNQNKIFKPWFFRILINTIKDRYRYLKKNKFVDIDYFQQVKNISEEKKIEEFQLRETILGIINKLPEKLKSVVLLKNYSEMNLKEVAKTSNISVRQLHNRLAKAYEIILKELKK